MALSRHATRVRSYAVLVLLGIVFAACGQPPAPPTATLSISGATATSQTSVVVSFSATIDEATVLPAAFSITAPNGTQLGVLDAFAFGDGKQVALATAPQQLVNYDLTVNGIGSIELEAAAATGLQAGFAGSDSFGPVVAHAIPLTNTTVLVTFADPAALPGASNLVAMSDSALDTSKYVFEPADLTTYGAAFASGGTDRSRVILTTTPQEDGNYDLDVASILTEAGGVLLDPFQAGARFRGIAANDQRAPGISDIQAESETGFTLRFSEPINEAAANPINYRVEDPQGNELPIVAAELSGFGTQALVTTWPLTQGVEYTLMAITGATDAVGNPLTLGATTTFTYSGAPGSGSDSEPPRVLGANSLSPTEVVVSFSEPVYGAEDARKYQIVDRASHGELTQQALVLVESVTVSANRRSVTLTTRTQSAIMYALSVNDVSDAAGNQLAPPDRDNPFQVTFMGTAASGTAEDRDGDGLSDAAEQAGWTVTVTLANGQVTTTKVTSDPDMADTDGDGVSDRDERSYLTNPRSGDSDSDQLSDYWELNHVYSDPAHQDTDGDGLQDGLEYNFFRTSPNLADTDGDQLLDGYEIQLANRDPRLADLPLPAIEIGEVDLQLDVRFSATSQRGTREVESVSATSTLVQTESESFSNTDSNSHQFFFKAGVEAGFKVGADVEISGKVTAETGYTGQWTSSFTRESSDETQRSHANTLSTEQALAIDESLSREVVGASMRLGVTLESIGGIAFNISNLQVTAFVQDQRRPERLIPIATLVPENEPAGGFNLGPLVPERGPLIFIADQVFPSLVDQLMQDPEGLVFKISNFDLEDEFGRNFAFASQEISDRTATLVIDYGAADSDGDGEGDNTERLKIATSAGRPIDDLNGDGVIDDADRILFDIDGDQVGITMRDALENVLGLRHVDEVEDPSNGLSLAELQESYSTRDIGGVQTLWRIRTVSKDLTNPLMDWEVLTPTGIRAGDNRVDFNSEVLRTEVGITLAFVQDLDDDGVPARWEYILGCSDNNEDTDGDTLDDRFEVYEGWLVQVVGVGSYQGYASCARTDSDLDGLSDLEEMAAGTDAKVRDTDGDGLSDAEELNGVTIDLRFGGTVTRQTDPLNPDTDGDTLPDGAERDLGADPLVDDGDRVFDDDGDGLVNFEESDLGWMVSYYGVSSTALAQGNLSSGMRYSDPQDPDSDNDGLLDDEEKELGTDPTNSDTDGDGLSDFEEVELGFDPLDADMDDDLRSDGEEFNDALLVSVTGQTPYSVKSDPQVPDVDSDGLVDGQEEALGTDPTEADTDGDGTADGHETTLTLDPLRADQRIRVSFVSMDVLGTCESFPEGDLQNDVSGNGEFSGTVSVERPDGTSFDLRTLDRYSGSYGQTHTFNNSHDFTVLDGGGGFRIYSSNFLEYDVGITNVPLGQISPEAHSYPVMSGSRGQEIGPGADCRIRINIAWEVLQ